MKSDILATRQASYLSRPKKITGFLFRTRWKQKPDRHTIAIEIISVLLMMLFGLTAIDKAVQFERFYTELGKSPFLMAYQGWVAWGTPIVEGIVVFLLVYGGTLQLWGLYASVFLMSLFTGYIYLLLNYSYYTPCLCSAALESLTWEQHLAFNFLFLAIAITATALCRRQRQTHKNNKP